MDQQQGQNQNPENQKSNTWVWIAAIGILIVFTIIAILKNPSDKTSDAGTDDTNLEQDMMMDDQDQERTDAERENFVGILQESDNQAIGNLMLVQEGRNVYLFTSRDYSSLIGQEVKLVVEGSLERFRLVDIVPAE